MQGNAPLTLGNCWLVTMDGAGTEHERGWLRIEDGLVAEVGAGDAPEGADDLGGAACRGGLVPAGLRRRAGSFG